MLKEDMVMVHSRSELIANQSGESVEQQEGLINIHNKADRGFLRELLQLVKAFQVVTNEEKVTEYLNMIRLRSFVSQHKNLHHAKKDGFIYPFLLFSARENDYKNSESSTKNTRMIELNFVEEVLNIHTKDHSVKSYHISMVEKVIRGFNYDEFIIEIQNESCQHSYFATFPLQRDFIVEMILFAIVSFKKSQIGNKGINCPDNHNFKKQKDLIPDLHKHLEPTVQVELITDDYVLPPKALLIGPCLKKNKTIGWEKRYLLLGYS